MSYYDRLLQDLILLETEADNSSTSLNNKIVNLKLVVRYILPYWNSRSADFLTEANKVYPRLLSELDLDALEEFVDNELRDLRCHPCYEFHASCFYSGNSELEYDRLKFIEQVQDNLTYAEATGTNLSVSIKEFIAAFVKGMKQLFGFGKLMAKWNVNDLVESKDKIQEVSDYIELLPRKAAYVCRFYTEFGNENLLEQYAPYLQNMKSVKLKAEEVYLQVLRASRLDLKEISCMDYANLYYFIGNLETILKNVSEDLPSVQMSEDDTRRILLELEFIKSVVERAFTKPSEDRDSIALDVICTHVDILVADALYIIQKSEKTTEFRDHDSWSKSMSNEQEKMLDIRSFMRLMTTNMEFSYIIDDILKFLSLLVEVGVLNSEAIESQVRELKSLRRLLQDAEKLSHLKQVLLNECSHIKVTFAGFLWDIRSHWFRYLRSERDPIDLCLKLLSEITAQIPHTNTVLLDLVKCASQMQLPDELLLNCLNSVISSVMETLKSDATMTVPVKQHGKTLINEMSILRCILVNLQTQHWGEKESADLFRHVKVKATEAASIYTSLFKDVDEEIQCVMEETIGRFKASVRQAYLKFAKLKPSEVMLSNSEVVFQDMLGNLRGLKNSGVEGGFALQIGALHDAMLLCSSFLQQNTLKNDEAEEVMHLRSLIMKMGCKVENLIDAFEMVPDWFSEMWLVDVTEEVNLIKEEITKISCIAKAPNQTEQLKQKTSFGDEANYAANTEQAMLGFEEQENQLKRQLTAGTQQREIISIVGMPGLGKTTLALNVYKSCAKFFHAHAWCYVSQEFERKELLQNILSQVNGRPSSSHLGEEDLANLLKQILMSKKNYLIVLDDIWDVGAWNALKQCFPAGNNRSRILITSRYKTVALKLNLDKSSCLELGLLNAENSWRLLANKIFGARSCSPKLSAVGKEIADKCGGLPLSVVVIAGILKNIDKTEDRWKEVAENLESHLDMNQDGVFGKLELSYNHLPIHMKQCFLYCGSFLKGKEIPRGKLVQLWCAERFTEDCDQGQGQESVAEKYLSDLVDRSLLIAAKTGFNNRIQTCRIHDLLRDYAIKKATEDKFLITTNRYDCFTCFQRRLCLTSVPDKNLHSQQSFPFKSYTRSLLVAPTLHAYQYDGISFICDYFKSLVILDLEHIDLSYTEETDSKLYKSVTEMKLLKYFAVRDSIKKIPPSFGELLHLETLIIRGTRGEIEVPDTIFNMLKLRYLLVNGRARVYENEGGSALSNIENFSTPCLYSHNAQQILSRLPSLRKLRCIFQDEWIEFSILNCLQCLESLKVFYYGLVPYPGMVSLPLSLRKLTLSKFRLPWSKIERIATLLPQLEILKLLFKAFEGSTWKTIGTFQNLKFFTMEELDIRDWESSNDSFPNLQRLIVRGCRRLVSIPKAFCKIIYLNGIEVYMCNPSAVKSALKIQRKQIDDGNMMFETITYPILADIGDNNVDDDDDDSGELSE